MHSDTQLHLKQRRQWVSNYDLHLEIFKNFYQTPRLGMDMSDGGGAFGFDIHHALEACYLIHHYNCDAILETGTNSGDTTEFLARMFPSLPILTCEIQQKYVDVANIRLKGYDNVKVFLQSSEKFLAQYAHKYNLPFVFLDAHWNDYWPLHDELNIVKSGVVCVDDCDIGDIGFGYDAYNGVVCNPEMISKALGEDIKVFTNNPHSEYTYPCMQKARRGGRGYYVLGKDTDIIEQNENFKLSEV